MEGLLGLFLGAIITFWVLKYIKIQKRKDITNSQSSDHYGKDQKGLETDHC